MRVLEVSRYKKEYAEHMLPFVKEQGEAIAKVLRELEIGDCKLENEPSAVEYFLVRGNYVKAVGALKAKIREFKPDVVHAHYGLSAITAELQGLVPVVTTFHNGETHNWHVNLLSSLMSLRAKHVIYVAQHIHDMVYFKAKHYSIIPCGVSLKDCVVMDKAEARKKLGWSDDKKYILFGGAFENLRKNYALLREAVDILEENNKNNIENTENTIITKKEESELACSSSNNLDPKSAQKQAFGQPSAQSRSVSLTDSSEKNSSKNAKNDHADSKIEIVEMRGLSRAECVLRMNACDVFALPTKNEGSPQALKEAMACNCPIVATDVADIKHLLGDLPGHYVLPNKKGNCAWWKGDEHSAEELAELLKKALAFEGRTKGRERIVELGYTNELVARQIVDIYNSIIKKEK